MHETGGMRRRNHFTPQVLERWQGTAGAGTHLRKVTSAKCSPHRWDMMNSVAVVTVSYCHLSRWDPITSASDTSGTLLQREARTEPSTAIPFFLSAAVSFPGQDFAIQPFEHPLKHARCSTALSRKTTYLLHFMFWGQLIAWWVVKQHFIADQSNCWK